MVSLKHTNLVRKGSSSKVKLENVLTKKPLVFKQVGGEFARGFDDGYYGRTVTEQKYTVQDSQESYTGQACRTYYYNEKDSIDQILRNVTRDLERDLKKQWNISD